MAKVNGKAKGNAFERRVANILSEKFAPYTGIEKSVRRNPDSGSFFGGQNIERKDVYDTEWAVYGDLMCPRNFNFSIECKNYKKPPTFTALLKQEIKEWDEWIAQARQDAAASEKQMLLIIKYNNTEIFTITEPDTIEEEPVFTYKNTHIHRLEQVLEQPDSFFFNESTNE